MFRRCSCDYSSHRSPFAPAITRRITARLLLRLLVASQPVCSCDYSSHRSPFAPAITHRKKTARGSCRSRLLLFGHTKTLYTYLLFQERHTGGQIPTTCWQAWLKLRSGPSQNGRGTACSLRSAAQYEEGGYFFLPGVPPGFGARPLQAGGRHLFSVKRHAFRRCHALQAAEASKNTHGNTTLSLPRRPALLRLSSSTVRRDVQTLCLCRRYPSRASYDFL